MHLIRGLSVSHRLIAPALERTCLVLRRNSANKCDFNSSCERCKIFYFCSVLSVPHDASHEERWQDVPINIVTVPSVHVSMPSQTGPSLVYFSTISDILCSTAPVFSTPCLACRDIITPRDLPLYWAVISMGNEMSSSHQVIQLKCGTFNLSHVAVANASSRKLLLHCPALQQPNPSAASPHHAVYLVVGLQISLQLS